MKEVISHGTTPLSFANRITFYEPNNGRDVTGRNQMFMTHKKKTKEKNYTVSSKFGFFSPLKATPSQRRLFRKDSNLR